MSEPVAQRSAFTAYFRCADDLAPLSGAADASAPEGYFTLDGALSYGRLARSVPARYVTDRLPEAGPGVTHDGGRLVLPFDLTEAILSFQQERYRPNAPRYLDTFAGSEIPRRLYYFLRPGLSVPLRRHLQKLRLNGWERLAFPRWPVDFTVENLMRTVMTRVVAQHPAGKVPFIWFWPDGASSCGLMTHDVEGPAGEAFCETLMDIDDAFGIKSAFQIVPQVPSRSSEPLRRRIRARGFEVNLHDLNHDGHLFSSREQFLERAVEINKYAREFQSAGFRSGAMYREQAWYDAFQFQYDMSVPNVAHLEPQRGGCCTVMPYFIGRLLEMPLTTTQDYSLFNILSDYSTDLWKRQAELIMAQHGLISVITHPDYLVGPREQAVYRELLGYLADLRARRGLWITLPADLNRWWRSRDAMSLVPDGASWRIEGAGSDRARVAWATVDNGCLSYTVDRG